MSFHVPEQRRCRAGDFGSDESYGNNGAFTLPPLVADRHFCVIASDGLGWEHVSVHMESPRGKQWTPTWAEMCHVKDVFWDADDVVVQYHPRRVDYVNFHPHTLHLWRPIGVELPLPDPDLVGPGAEEVSA